MKPIYSSSTLDHLYPQPEEVQEMVESMHNGNRSGSAATYANYGSTADNNHAQQQQYVERSNGGGFNIAHTPITAVPSGGAFNSTNGSQGNFTFPTYSPMSTDNMVMSGNSYHHQQQQPHIPHVHGTTAAHFASNASFGSLQQQNGVSAPPIYFNNNMSTSLVGNFSMSGGIGNNNSIVSHQRTGTVAGVTMNTLCNVMGAGVLALPLAVHNGSVVMSLLLLLLSAWVSLKAVHILGLGCDATHRYSFTECVVLNLFPASIEERRDCISRGIDPMLNMRKRLIATLLLEFVIVIESFGTLVVYARVIADSMPPILEGLGLNDNPTTMLILSWVLPAAIFFALSCSRSMEELKWTSLIGFGTILYIVAVVVYKYFEFVYDHNKDFFGALLSSSSSAGGGSAAPLGATTTTTDTSSSTGGGGFVWHADGIRWFSLDLGNFAAMSTYSLAFGYHFNVPYFYSELRDRRPTNLLKTVHYALPIVTISYALTGVLGYLQFGPKVAGKGAGNIVDRFDATSFLVNVGRVGLLFHFATVYPVISVCARRGLHRFLALVKLCFVGSNANNDEGRVSKHTGASPLGHLPAGGGVASMDSVSVGDLAAGGVCGGVTSISGVPSRANSADNSQHLAPAAAHGEKMPLLGGNGSKQHESLQVSTIPSSSRASSVEMELRETTTAYENDGTASPPSSSSSVAGKSLGGRVATTKFAPPPAMRPPLSPRDEYISPVGRPASGGVVGNVGLTQQQLVAQQQQQGPRRTMPPKSANFSVNSFSNLPLTRPPVPGDPATTTKTAIVFEALAIVLFGTLCAWFVPGVGLVIEVLGAFFGIPTQMIIPGVIGVKLFSESSGFRNRWWMGHVTREGTDGGKGMLREKRIAMLLIVIGVVCTVFGVTNTVVGMREDYLKEQKREAKRLKKLADTNNGGHEEGEEGTTATLPDVDHQGVGLKAKHRSSKTSHATPSKKSHTG